MFTIERWRCRPLLPALAAALLLSACQTIPDVSGWTQATRELSGAVGSGFQVAATVNGDIGRRLALQAEAAQPPDEAAAAAALRYREAALQLDKRSADYDTVFAAMADYAAALDAISKAADNSGKTVDAVAGSLNQLVGALGGTALVGAGFELGKLLAGEVIKVRAAKDFADAVERADPVVARLADLLAADLADLGKTVADSKDEAIRQAVRLPHANGLRYRRALERRRVTLQQAVAATVAPAAPPGSAGPAPTAALSGVADAASELVRIDQALRETEAWYQPMQAQLDQALKHRASTAALAAQTGSAVLAWKASHATLAAAVRERRLPETARLVALAQRIRGLVADLKKE